MSDQITISLNEWRALLGKALEGVFGHSRDWRAITETIIWLEGHGYPGMSLFFEAYPNMRADLTAQIIVTTDNNIEVSSPFISILEYSHLLGDILIAKLSYSDRINVRIKCPKHMIALTKVQYRVTKETGLDFSFSKQVAHAVIEVTDPYPRVAPKRDFDNSRYQQILDNGYTMTRADYIKLCEYADKVLVPATERSRRGAGE